MDGELDQGEDRGGPIAPVWGYVLALPLCALATLAAVMVDRWVAVPNLSLVFVLPVVILAVTFGWGSNSYFLYFFSYSA